VAEAHLLNHYPLNQPLVNPILKIVQFLLNSKNGLIIFLHGENLKLKFPLGLMALYGR
jgi:hypothetical protein